MHAGAPGLAARGAGARRGGAPDGRAGRGRHCHITLFAEPNVVGPYEKLGFVKDPRGVKARARPRLSDRNHLCSLFGSYGDCRIADRVGLLGEAARRSDDSCLEMPCNAHFLQQW